MNVHLTDSQVVGETSSTLFTLKGTTEFMVTLKNAGVNTMNYRFQEFNGSAWVDLDDSGTDFYNTLSADQTKNIKVAATYPQVRIVGNASGGAYLEFALMSEANREDGGGYTILAA